MKKLFPLLIIALSILVSCQKKSVEPFPAPVNNVVSPLSLTDSTKLALFNTTFTIVADYLFMNTNVVLVDTALGFKKMYDTWTIDAVGNCTVTPYTYNCSNSYVYDVNNFPYILHQYASTITFSISIHGDTVNLPPINPFCWDRVSGVFNTVNELKYKTFDPSNNGLRCFETFTPTSFPNNFNRYSIK
jgi:hypothetical protein